jgi:hypothetical protein
MLKRAHRIAYELCNGPIPPGLSVLHNCDNRHCINPAHLTIGTHAENMKAMLSRNRSARGIKQHKAKLTDNRVAYIKAMRGVFDAKTLAAKFSVTHSAIRDIWRGRTWRHI